MKLQKLVFYSHAYSLSRFGEPLFPETFEAWVNGPVCPELFNVHRGKFIVGPGEIAPDGEKIASLSNVALSVEAAVSTLGGMDGRALSELTHREDPWVDARSGCSPSERCSAEISNDAIAAYYGSPVCTNPLFADV